MGKRVMRLGTRGSLLALWQANFIKSEIERTFPGLLVELVRIKTTGDRILDVPLAKVGGKGLFVKEIEEALLSGKIDLAVHSMKDVPTLIPEGLEILVTTKREDPRDALICPSGKRLEELPVGSLIGTSSLRRQTQLLHRYPGFKVETLRGNLDTRLRKVKEGQYDAIILAAAGLKRLKWDEHVTEFIDTSEMLPAIGQGALGLEVRAEDGETGDAISFLNHEVTARSVAGERSFLERLEGGCQVPIAAHGVLEGDSLTLRGLVGSTDGKQIVKGIMVGSAGDAEELGRNLAEDILSRGGKEILEEVYRTENHGEE